MRVTGGNQDGHPTRILDAAQTLFAEKGFEATTTRDIAVAAEIAIGTLFNYFPTKDAIVRAWSARPYGEVAVDSGRAARGRASLEEDLFALVAAGLRKLKPLRKHLKALLETSLSPLAESDRDGGRRSE